MSYLNLNKDKTILTVRELNILLADYHLYYQKLRNFHWNIVGKNFFDLHIKFEELYEDAKIKIDEIAERILTLRFHPVSNFSEYLSISNLNECTANKSDVAMVKMLLEDHTSIILQLRKVMEKAIEAADEGTIDLIGTYVAQLEKVSWMLDAWTMKADDSHPKA